MVLTRLAGQALTLCGSLTLVLDILLKRWVVLKEWLRNSVGQLSLSLC